MILDSTGHEANGNGASLTDRQRKKWLGLNATNEDVEKMANEIAHGHAVAATNHLGNQIPALIHSIIRDAIRGYDEAKREQFEAVAAQFPDSPAVQALRLFFGKPDLSEPAETPP